MASTESPQKGGDFVLGLSAREAKLIILGKVCTKDDGKVSTTPALVSSLLIPSLPTHITHSKLTTTRSITKSSAHWAATPPARPR